jgi:hypothetical protein
VITGVVALELEHAQTQPLTGQATVGLALLQIKALLDPVRQLEEYQAITSAIKLMEEVGTGPQELYLLKQPAPMVIIMIGIQIQFGIMILGVGEDLRIHLMEMIAALSG